jgi:peptidyl-prolyl cis-trans isomerase B (cyclophilin B)
MFSSTLCALLLTSVTFGTAFGIADDAEQLLNRYQMARTSIMNQRGLAPGDIDSVAALREELTAWNVDHEDLKLIAAELQMSVWLDEIDRCNTLFGRLADIEPENAGIGLAWAQFLIEQEGSSAEEVYTDLIERYPNSPEIALDWVSFLDSHNRFTEGIKVIEKMKADGDNSPLLSEKYADLLFANNLFDEAVAILETIDLEENPSLSTKVNIKKTKYQKAADLWTEELAIREAEEINNDLPQAQIITSKGQITIKLFEDHAPNTVANFISLAESGYYDGTRFHRVLPKFMVQGGDPNSREGANSQAGTGGPGYTIKDEHTGEDIRKHFAGSLSMAKTSAPNSGGSQFFLTHLPTSHLDGRHTVFGRITDGLEIARSLEQNDDIVTIVITNKRDHEYTPETIGSPEKPVATKKENKSKLPKPTLNSGSK